MRSESLWLSWVLLLGSACAFAQDPAAEFSGQFLRESCWSESLAAMMIALDVRELGPKAARRIHVDENPNARAASAGAQTLAVLEKSPGLDPVSFTIARHLACVAERVPGVSYPEPVLGECFVHSAMLQRFAVAREGKVPVDNVLERVRAIPDGPGYGETRVARESSVREIFRLNAASTNRYSHSEFLACVVARGGTKGDPQIETIAKMARQQQCWSMGELALDNGADRTRKINADALTDAARRYSQCMEAAPVEVRSQAEGPVASCYARTRPHSMLAAWRESGRSKEDARKTLMAAAPKAEAALAQVDQIVDWAYSGPAQLNEFKLFGLFRACVAPPPPE